MTIWDSYGRNKNIRVNGILTEEVIMADKLGQKLLENNFRVKIKDESESLSKKIRTGQLQKIPYLLIVGDKEMKTKSISPRFRGKDLGQIKLTSFIKRLTIEIEKKK